MRQHTCPVIPDPLLTDIITIMPVTHRIPIRFVCGLPITEFDPILGRSILERAKPLGG